MNISLAADGIVSILLVITIFYGVILSRRLSALRADKVELQGLVQNLAIATQSAEAGVKGLRAAADDIGRQLEKKVSDALSLRDDLSYMLERGGNVADRLEGDIRARREEPKPETSRPRAVEAQRPAMPRALETQRAAPPRQEPKLAAVLAEQMAARLAPAGAPSRAERELLRALGGRR
jgi:hypothetical protein